MTVSEVSSNIPYQQEEKPVHEPVGDSDLDRQDFMELFMTQMQHQDPMKPMESDDMAAQMAQFSNMEATQDMADNLQEMLDYQKSGNNLQLLNLIDKDVAVAGNQIGVSAENRGRGEFVLDDSAAACKVNIYDEGGNPVKSLDKGHLDPGRHDVGWDGTDARGEEVPTGEYHYEVKANDAKGNSLETDTYGIGRVTGVDFNGDNQELTIDKHVTTSADKINKVL